MAEEYQKKGTANSNEKMDSRNAASILSSLKESSLVLLSGPTLALYQGTTSVVP